MTTDRAYTLKALLIFAALANIALWFYARPIRGEWTNVPPVPSQTGAAAFALGDTQFAYRAIGFMIQNLGDSGGRATPLKAYNYEELVKWFYLLDSLDSESAYIPSLAAFYFGAVDEKEKLYPLLDYLAHIGARPEGQNWRWLAHAVYLARFTMNDLDTALELARKLAAVPNPDMPPWTRQMPAFILEAKGDKRDALSIMMEILIGESDKLDPAEVYYMREYICTRALEPAEAAAHPVCEDLPLDSNP